MKKSLALIICCVARIIAAPILYGVLYCMLYFLLEKGNFKKVSLVKEKDNVLGILKMSLNQKSVKYFPRNTHSNMTRRCSKFRNV
jgi:hypothetical protein